MPRLIPSVVYPYTIERIRSPQGYPQAEALRRGSPRSTLPRGLCLWLPSLSGEGLGERAVATRLHLPLFTDLVVVGFRLPAIQAAPGAVRRAELAIVVRLARHRAGGRILP